MKDFDEENQWTFGGTCWQFLDLVRVACVGWELHKRGRSVLQVFSDHEKLDATADEYGITYETVKNVMRNTLDLADMLDELIDKDNACNVLKTEQ